MLCAGKVAPAFPPSTIPSAFSTRPWISRKHLRNPRSCPSIREWTAHCRDLIRAQTAETLPIYLALGLLYRTEQITVSANEAARTAARIDFRERSISTHWA